MSLEIKGEVDRVVAKDGFKFIAFNVIEDSGKARCIFYSGFLPVDPGDKVHIVGREEENDRYGKIIVPDRRPLIILPTADEFIIDCFHRSKLCNHMTATKLYMELEKTYKDPKGVDDYLTRISVEGMPDGYNLPFLSSWNTTKLLWWWKKNVSYRRLYLLGLKKSDIDNTGLAPDLLYYELLSNPIKIPSLSIKKALEICTILGKEWTAKDVECGEIVRYIYRNCSSKGWTGTPEYEIQKKYDYASLKDEIKENYGLIEYKDLIYFKYNFDAEDFVAKTCNQLIKLTAKNYLMRSGETDYRPYNKKLSDEQTSAAKGALEHSICIITGGAGTGKTSTIREVVLNLELQERDYRVCAISGKAVGRINEVLRFGDVNRKKKAYTIDRLIAQGDFAPILIFDESSMITVDKLYRLGLCYKSRGIPLERIIMVGDCNQLPPIGWGSIFSQLICCERVPVYRLTRNYRIEKAQQLKVLDEGDIDPDDRIYVRGILENANSVIDPDRDYRKPVEMVESDGFFTIDTSNIIKVKKVLKAIKKYNVDVDSISAVVPYKSDVPVINKFFQEVFHSGSEGVQDSRGNIWLVGDRVMQTVNNYEINVYNGTEGTVIRVTSGVVTVDFGGERYQYLINDRDEKDTKTLNISQITHSYCKTVHKAQGSEYRFLIVFISKDSPMLTVNFLYTALTRAKMKIWLMVDKKVIAKMTTRLLPKRHERLTDRLVDMKGDGEDEMYELCKYQRVIGDSLEGTATNTIEIQGEYECVYDDFDDFQDGWGVYDE
jgi:exodeoxyribonuclease V alpha subunit